MLDLAFPRLQSLGVQVIRSGSVHYVDQAELYAALDRLGLLAKFKSRTKGERKHKGGHPFAWDAEVVIEELLHQAE